MLPSCIICKKRKKKCDFNLPSCKHCESMGTQCEYYDEGLDNNVPREYLKSLNDNVIALRNEIEKYRKKINKRTSQNGYTVDKKNRLYEVIKNGTLLEGTNSELHYFGPCSLVSMIYMSSMMLDLRITSLDRVSILDYKSIPPVKMTFDYGMITSDHSKVLITNYLTNIYPSYPLLSESFFHFDLMVKNYPDKKQLFILLILLISSAQIMRKRTDFVPIKVMLQQKVLEIMKTKLSHEDGDSLLAFLLYALYESFDPETGKSMWKTLSSACAIAERLQLKNLDNTKPLPGLIACTIPRSQFLKVLVFLDSEMSLCLGNSPSISLSKNQILNLKDLSLQSYFLQIFEKVQFYNTLYANSSGCDIVRLFESPMLTTQNDPNIWILASPLLSHNCTSCEAYFSTVVMNILNASIAIIGDYDLRIKGTGITLYWVALSKISTAVLNLILIKKLYYSNYFGLLEKSTVVDNIILGQRLVSQISSQWYSANSIKSFIDMACAIHKLQDI